VNKDIDKILLNNIIINSRHALGPHHSVWPGPAGFDNRSRLGYQLSCGWFSWRRRTSRLRPLSISIQHRWWNTTTTQGRDIIRLELDTTWPQGYKSSCS